MTCRCNNPTPTPKKAVVGFCDVCDPCKENHSEARICAFVVPSLEEGRYFKNSFIFAQDEDAVYFITEERSEIPFGSRPKFIDNFDPEDSLSNFKNSVVYDMAKHIAYIYGKDGNYLTFPITDTPITGINEGEGITVTHDGGEYTISADLTEVASTEALQAVSTTVANHTAEIEDLTEGVSEIEGEVETLAGDVADAKTTAEAAQTAATAAGTAASTAQTTADQAVAGLAGKQDTLTAGENITINGTEISATATTYSPATTTANGLMTSADRTQMVNGIHRLDDGITANASTIFLNVDKFVSSTNGTSYTQTADTLVFPVASSTQAGVMNPTIFNAIQANSDSIDAILSGSVAVQNLPASPTQAQLTTAWQTATGLTDLINGAKIFDNTNSKVWTYYTNTTTWYGTPAGEVSVSTATNSALGIVQGDATTEGKVFVENNGTMSVNGWDDVTADIADNATNIATLQTDKVDKVTGKQLSTEDYTTAEKTKLAGIEAGAEVNDPNTVIDASYVHTDNNYTTTEKNKLAGLENTTVVQTTGSSTTSVISQAAVTTALGAKANSANLTHETWTFTLADNTTVDKEVVLWEA